MDYWTTIDAYLEADNLLDVEYAHLLFNSCHLTQLHVYRWLEFCDQTGVDDPGDYYVHTVYPEARP